MDVVKIKSSVDIVGLIVRDLDGLASVNVVWFVWLVWLVWFVWMVWMYVGLFRLNPNTNPVGIKGSGGLVR